LDEFHFASIAKRDKEKEEQTKKISHLAILKSYYDSSTTVHFRSLSLEETNSSKGRGEENTY
jgi:hypothetical protein